MCEVERERERELAVATESSRVLKTFSANGGVLRGGTGQQSSYPLRPELAEATYYLYRATRDPLYLRVGAELVTSLQLARTTCGYAMVADVRTGELTDTMESFFLAETLKYLYLLFDAGFDNGALVHTGAYQYVFTTEGHLLPIHPNISNLSHLPNLHPHTANATPAVPAPHHRSSRPSRAPAPPACPAVPKVWEVSVIC